MCSVETTKERPVEGHGRYGKRSGWRRDGGIGESEVVDGVQVNVGIWNDRGSWHAEF